MSDNNHMRQFTATPTVEELEAEIERLFASEQWLLSENAKLQAVVDAAKSELSDAAWQNITDIARAALEDE